MNEMTLRAYGKINLTLDVGPPRADGYHAICSVMQAISLHDTLTIRRAFERPGLTLTVMGDEAEGVPSDSSNLAWRAAARMQEMAGNRVGLSIHLHKAIPSQAGLGGGSADAAAALRGVNGLLDLRLPVERLAEIGAELGGDVPFFLTGGMALVEGKGERVTPLPGLTEDWHLVIVKPSVGVSTAWAYGALDQAPGRVPGQRTQMWLAGQQRPGNDFEAVVLRAAPQVQAVFAWLASDEDVWAGTCPVLCGSGSAVFCRAASRVGARRLAQRAQDAGLGKAWAVTSVGRKE